MYHYYEDGDLYCESCAFGLCETQEEQMDLGNHYSIMGAADRIIRCERCGEHWEDCDLTDDGFEYELESLIRNLETPEDFSVLLSETPYVQAWTKVEGGCFSTPGMTRGNLVAYTADVLYKHIGYNTDWRSEIIEKTLGQVGHLVDSEEWVKPEDIQTLKTCARILKEAQKLPKGKN